MYNILMLNKKGVINMERNSKDINQFEVFSVPAYNGNAYIFDGDGIWTAPLFVNGTVDNTQWAGVYDNKIVNTVLDSNEKIVLHKITVANFLNFITN